MASNSITNLYFFRRKSKAWTAQDLADLARLEAAMRRCGLNIESEHGCSDEGDPWFIFTCVDTEDPIIHIAYIDGFFVIASGFGEPLKDRALGAAVESFLTRHVARLPVAQTPDAASNVVAHPAALLPGLVAPLVVKNLSENLNNSYSTGVPLPATGNHGWVTTAASRLKDQGSFPAAAILLAALAAALHQHGSLGPSDETQLPVDHAVAPDVAGATMDVAISDPSQGGSGTGTGASDADLHHGSMAQHVSPPPSTSPGTPERLQIAEITGAAPHVMATASVDKSAGRVLPDGGESPLAGADSAPDQRVATDEISDAVKQAIDLMLAGGRSSNSAPEAEPQVQLASLDPTGEHLPEYLVADDHTSDAPAAERILAARQSLAPQESYPAGDHPDLDGLSHLTSPAFPENATPPEPDHTAGSPTVSEPGPSSTLIPPSPPSPPGSDKTPTDQIVSNDRVISLVENFMDNNRNVHIRGEGGKDAFGQGGGDIVYTTSDLHDPPSPEKTFVLTTLAATDGTHITLIGYLSTDVWLV